MIRVLFVCLGNICRSPMAEGVFRNLVAEQNLSQHFEIDSAGIGGWHTGETAHRGTLNILRKAGIDYQGRARQIKVADMNDFDYVLAMDRSNLNELRSYQDAGATIMLFLDEARKRGLVDVDEVPDPYYTGRFDYVYDLVKAGAEALLDRIKQEHTL